MISNTYGFRSAEAAYENATPYDNECDCEPLFQCDMGHWSNTAGDCTECEQKDFDPENWPVPMEEQERHDANEGILTDSRCTIHNHICTSRDCCD